MKSEPTDPSRAAVQEQLAAIEKADSRARVALAGSARSNGGFLFLMGLLFGGLAAAVGMTEHASHLGLVISIFVFAVLLQIVMFWRQKTKIATGRGWSARSGGALGATLVLYVAGVVLAAFQVMGPVAGFWFPYAVVTALPMVVVGVLDLRSS